MHFLFNSCGPIFQFGQENEQSSENIRTPYSYYGYDDKTSTYTIAVEMPGISKDMVEITATNYTVTIRTKNDGNKDSNALQYYRKFDFRTKIDPNMVTATFKDGLLELKVKKDIPSAIEVKIT